MAMDAAYGNDVRRPGSSVMYFVTVFGGACSLGGAGTNMPGGGAGE
jgi:hypothetical protein